MKGEYCLEVYADFRDGITYLIEWMLANPDKKGSRRILIELFNSLWKLVATYNLYRTYSGSLGIDPAVVRSFLAEKTKYQIGELMDQFAIA